MPNGLILATQTHYIIRILKKFNLNEANPVSVPADVHQNLTLIEENNSEKTVNFPYREAVGSLMFLAMVTRPDIAFSVGVVSRHCEKPTKIHWNAVKRIFKYLKGTIDFGLVF